MSETQVASQRRVMLTIVHGLSRPVKWLICLARPFRAVASFVVCLAASWLLVQSIAGFTGLSGGEVKILSHSIGLRGLEVEHDYELRPIVWNGTRRPVQIVGAGATCGSHGCYSAAGLPATVPPGARYPLAVHFKAGAPGGFAHVLSIYTDRPSQPVLEVRIEGIVRERGPHDNPAGE
jgi:hypothetical protein